jgi:selT/selW/selH-like putative selenoprotein
VAAGLADKLKSRYDVEPHLIESGGGVFEVEVDGRLVFSKKKQGRFPEDEEIFRAVDAALPGKKGGSS